MISEYNLQTEEAVSIVWLWLNKEGLTNHSWHQVPVSEYVFFFTQRSIFQSKQQS